MIEVKIGSVALAHLQDTSPGSLSDEQLGQWGYEPEWADAEFVRECREAVNHPVASRRVGKWGSIYTVEFPSPAHAEACASKLEEVGEDFAYGSGFDPETRPEGRAMLKGAERIRAAIAQAQG